MKNLVDGFTLKLLAFRSKFLKIKSLSGPRLLSVFTIGLQYDLGQLLILLGFNELLLLLGLLTFGFLSGLLPLGSVLGLCLRF